MGLQAYPPKLSWNVPKTLGLESSSHWRRVLQPALGNEDSVVFGPDGRFPDRPDYVYSLSIVAAYQTIIPKAVLLTTSAMLYRMLRSLTSPIMYPIG